VVTQTLTENGQTMYLTTTVEKSREESTNAEPATRFTEPPVTIFITKTETLKASGDPFSGEFPPTSSLAAMLTSAFSMLASTTSSYTLQSSQDTAGPANAPILTMVSTIYATLNASDCAANFRSAPSPLLFTIRDLLLRTTPRASLLQTLATVLNRVWRH
jgi:hypothetical protein